MTRNMSKNRGRERRTRPGNSTPQKITLKLNRSDRELLELIQRERGYSCEEIFRLGMDDIVA